MSVLAAPLVGSNLLPEDASQSEQEQDLLEKQAQLHRELKEGVAAGWVKPAELRGFVDGARAVIQSLSVSEAARHIQEMINFLPERRKIWFEIRKSIDHIMSRNYQQHGFSTREAKEWIEAMVGGNEREYLRGDGVGFTLKDLHQRFMEEEKFFEQHGREGKRIMKNFYDTQMQIDTFAQELGNIGASVSQLKYGDGKLLDKGAFLELSFEEKELYLDETLRELALKELAMMSKFKHYFNAGEVPTASALKGKALTKILDCIVDLHQKKDLREKIVQEAEQHMNHLREKGALFKLLMYVRELRNDKHSIPPRLRRRRLSNFMDDIELAFQRIQRIEKEIKEALKNDDIEYAHDLHRKHLEGQVVDYPEANKLGRTIKIRINKLHKKRKRLSKYDRLFDQAQTHFEEGELDEAEILLDKILMKEARLEGKNPELIHKVYLLDQQLYRARLKERNEDEETRIKNEILKALKSKGFTQEEKITVTNLQIVEALESQRQHFKDQEVQRDQLHDMAEQAEDVDLVESVESTPIVQLELDARRGAELVQRKRLLHAVEQREVDASQVVVSNAANGEVQNTTDALRELREKVEGMQKDQVAEVIQEQDVTKKSMSALRAEIESELNINTALKKAA